MKGYWVVLLLLAVFSGCYKEETVVKDVSKEEWSRMNTQHMAETIKQIQREPLFLEIVPSVKVNLEPVVIDLATKYYWSDEELAKLAEEDKRYADQPSRTQNSARGFETSVGTFRVVSCFGRQSTDPEAKEGGDGAMLMRFDMVELPNGKWISGHPWPFSIERVIEADNCVFLCADHGIFQWVGDDTLKCVVGFHADGKWQPRIRYAQSKDGRIAGRYYEVHKSNDSDFGGLLEYAGGQWKFHRYAGDYRNWIEDVKEEEVQLTLTLFGNDDPANAQKVRFDLATRSFVDL